MRPIWPLMLAGAAAAASAARASADDAPTPAADTRTVILDTAGFWRWRTVWETVDVVRRSGRVEHVRFDIERNWFRKNPGKVEVDAGHYKIVPVPTVRLPEHTSPDWMKPDFDDSTWARLRGPMLDGSKNPNWKLILMRGRFEVTDPAAAGDLALSVTYRGGLVVYLNGEELTREHMSAGPVTPDTPAAPYPEEVYLDDAGYVTWPHDDADQYRRRHEKRIRRLRNLRIPASKLKRGVNVIALGLHRPPSPEVLFIRRIKRYPFLDERALWCKVGLLDVSLTAPAGSSAAPNTSPPRGRGFLVWNHSIVRKVFIPDYPDPFALLRPVRLTGVRNGTFAGQVVVGHERPIRGLTAVASDLAGPGTIPATCVRLRWPRPDGRPVRRSDPPPFDSLESFPPAEAPVYKAHGGAVQPIWISVTVPADAAPGNYSGTITVSAAGVKPLAVPLRLRVIDWTLPDPNTFTARMDIVESTESVARAYGVKMWSDEHLALLDQVFALLKPLANKTIYVTAIRRTHWGNEHAMVRWVRGADGELTPNFDIVEKYLDVATKHLGNVPGVILDCWEPISSMGHAGGAGSATRTTDKPIQYTLWDPKRDKLRKRTGPAWGTAEARDFWRRFNEGIVPVLKKRGLANSMLFGLIGDARPTKQAMDDITTGVPPERAKWAVHSHYYCVSWKGYDVGMAIALWGVGSTPVDPSKGYGYGWANPFWLSYYPREMSMLSSLVEHRTKLEKWMGAKSRSTSAYSKAIGTRGLGRLGADFWIVLKDARGNLKSSLAGRYPESYWGQLNLNYGVPNLLGKGRDGPVPTVRSEAFRENVQEVEARVSIERALTDKAKCAALGDDLAARCRAALDKRIRMGLHASGEGLAWFVSSDWNKRTEDLFILAAEVAGKLEDQ